MRLDLQIEGDLNKILAGESRVAEAAVTAAVRKAGESLKTELRAQVVGAGLGRRLANAVRCNGSRLYSPAMARLTPLTIVETGEPSLSNCSAQ